MKTFKQFISEDLKNDSRIKDQGFYSAVYPDNESKEKLDKFCIKSFGKPSPDDVHCTVMYSTKSIGENDAKKFSKEKYKAYLLKLEYWDGHDKNGYLVAKLKSEDLAKEHSRLKKLGCKPTFDEYSPHITLITPIEKEDALKKVDIGNNNLDDLGVSLYFTDQSMDILKL